MRILLKKLLSCLRPPPKLDRRCVTTKRTDEKETGSRKQGSEKNGSFCLQHVQGLKDSAVHPHPNFFQVCLPPRPLAPGQDHAFFEQYSGASFALPGILHFRLIVTSYVSRCVSWHPSSQKKRWLKFTVSEGELVKSAFWLPVGQLLSIYWGQDILLTWSEKKVLNLNK